MKSRFFLLFISFVFSTSLIAENNYWMGDVVNNVAYLFDPDTKEAICTGMPYYNDEGEINTLETLYIPEYVTLTFGIWNPKEYICKVVGFSYMAFYNSKNLKSVSLPGSSLREVGEVPSLVFSQCEDLENVIVRNGAKFIGEGMFSSCPNLQTVNLPNSIKEICSNAFSGCKSLKSLTLPENIQVIRGGAFSNCDSLHIVLPRKLQVLSPYTFGGKIDAVIAHGPEAFSMSAVGYSEVNYLELGDEIMEIKDNVYWGRIHRLTIGDGLQQIKDEIDITIDEINCYATEPPFCAEGNNTFSYNTYKNATLVVPKESIEKYKNANGWKPFFYNGTLAIDVQKGYISNTQKILGVTADGESQLRIYPEFTNNNKDFIPVSYDLKVFMDDEDVTNNVTLTGEFKQYGELNNSKWGFIYTAPKDFPLSQYNKSKYDINIQLTVSDVKGEEIKMKRSISIARPGLLLLHGFMSNSECFGDFEKHLLGRGIYDSWQIRNADYHESNMESFDANTHDYKIVSKEIMRLCNNIGAHGFVCTKFDIVGHSMGGILARKYVQEVQYTESKVNRIITLDTPHSGSQIATLCRKVISPNIESSIKKLSAQLLLLDLIPIPAAKCFCSAKISLYSYIAYLLKHQAISDLMPSSEAIQILNQGTSSVPVHAIASSMTGTMGEEKAPEENDWRDWKIIFSIGSEIQSWVGKQNLGDKEFLDWMYSSPEHDAIVSYESQTGGLSGTQLTPINRKYLGTYGIKSSTFHCNTNRYLATYEEILSLLRLPASDSRYFATHFSPKSIVDAVEDYVNNSMVPQISTRRKTNEDNIILPSEDQYIKLNVQVDSINRRLYVNVSQSADIKNNMVFTILDENRLLLECDTTECVFDIPNSWEGDLTLYAIGEATNGAAIGDSIVIRFDVDESLSYLMFKDEYKTYINKGEPFVPRIIGGWDNGKEENVSPIFSTDNPDIISIDGQEITGLKEGECKLYASYLGQVDSIRVIVMPAIETPTGIQEVPVKYDASFTFNESQLQVYFEDSATDPITIDIYDLTGIRHISRRVTNVGVSSASVDVSSLAQGIYIATARTKNGVVKYKFVKKK